MSWSADEQGLQGQMWEPADPLEIGNQESVGSSTPIFAAGSSPEQAKQLEEIVEPEWIEDFLEKVEPPPADNTLSLCTPVVEGMTAWWPEQKLGLSVPAGGSVVMDIHELDGCDAGNADAVWTATGGTVVGDGTRINITADDDATMVSVEGCLVGENGESCASLDLPVGPASTKVFIDELETLSEETGGRWVRIHGTAEGMLPGTRVLVFKRSDAHYLVDESAEVDALGDFAVDTFLLDNVNQVSVAVAAPGPMEQFENCSSQLCTGAVDPLTRKRIPIKVDYQAGFALQELNLDRGTTQEPWVRALQSRLEQQDTGGALVGSRTDDNRAYVYDQALAVIALSSAGYQDEAASILDALSGLQNEDGSWYFMYYRDGTSPYPNEADVRYAGANAWVALAYLNYNYAFGLKDYAGTIEDSLDFLMGERGEVDGTLALRFNPVDLTATPWDETQLYSVEHNVDLHAALLLYQKVFKGRTFKANRKRYKAARKDLRTFVKRRFDNKRRYFRPGHYAGVGDNQSELYLESNVWTLMALNLNANKHGRALETACDRLEEPAAILGNDTYVRGVKTFAWVDRRGSAYDYGASISESLIYALGLRWSESKGRHRTCGGMSADDYQAQFSALAGTIDGVGGLPHGTYTDGQDFSLVSHTASISWMAMLDMGLNPFRPWQPLPTGVDQ